MIQAFVFKVCVCKGVLCVVCDFIRGGIKNGEKTRLASSLILMFPYNLHLQNKAIDARNYLIKIKKN